MFEVHANRRLSVLKHRCPTSDVRGGLRKWVKGEPGNRAVDGVCHLEAEDQEPRDRSGGKEASVVAEGDGMDP